MKYLCNNKQKYNIMKVSHLTLGCINNEDIHKYICNKMGIFEQNVDIDTMINNRFITNIFLSMIYDYICFSYNISLNNIEKYKWLFCDIYCPRIMSYYVYKQNKDMFLFLIYNTFNYVESAQSDISMYNCEDEYLYELTDYIRSTDCKYFMSKTIPSIANNKIILGEIVNRYLKDFVELYYYPSVYCEVDLLMYITGNFVTKKCIQKSIEMYVKYGPDINKPCGRFGYTPLITAIFNNINDVECLINNGADINKCDIHGVSPLMVAIFKNKKSLVYDLLNIGADCNHKNNYGHSVLDYVLYGKHVVNIAFVSMLMSYGAVSHMYRLNEINCMPQDRDRLCKILGRNTCNIM